jgi:rubredoxin
MADKCPHDSLSGDEGPVAELGRMPVHWRCDECGAPVRDADTCAMGNENPCPHGTRAGRYCPQCDSSPVKFGSIRRVTDEVMNEGR